MEIMKILPDGMPSGLSVNSFQIEGIPKISGLERWNGKAGSDVYSILRLRRQIRQAYPEPALAEHAYVPWFLEKAQAADAFSDDRIKAVFKETADGLGCMIYALVRQTAACREKNDLSDADWKFWRNCRFVYFIGGLFQKQAGVFLTEQINSRLRELGMTRPAVRCFSSAVTPSLLGCADVFGSQPQVYVFDFGSTRIKRAAAVRCGDSWQLHEYEAVWKAEGRYEDSLQSAQALHKQIVSVILKTVRETESDMGTASGQGEAAHIENILKQQASGQGGCAYAPHGKCTGLPALFISACISNNVLDGKLADRGNYCTLRLLDENYGAYLKKELEQKLGRNVSVSFMNDAQAAASLFRSDSPFAAVITCGTAMGIAYPRPDYRESDLVRIARRENNKKRSYLVVNRLQGKHIPAEPRQALTMFQNLAGLVKKAYGGEKLCVIGFAETATAIGAAIAVRLDAFYIQTTREMVPGVKYLYFSEEHSHASQQKLVKDDMDKIIGHAGRIVFAEDEVTTGNTILNIIRILEQQYPGQVSYAVASILNGMDDAALERYRKKNIPLHYLVKTDHKDYAQAAQRYASLERGRYVPCKTDRACAFMEMEIGGWMDARRLVHARRYEAACAALWQEIQNRRQFSGRVLVLGTEEFMYPALYAAAMLAESGADVRFHATTRSPIAVYAKEEYPLHTRYELAGIYDKDRKTFLYDIDAYDTVLILTDAHDRETEGVHALVNAVSEKNKEIVVIRWC